MTDVALQTAEKGGSTCRRSGVASIAAGLEEAHVSLLDEALDAVSADEISEMVSGALEDAILAAAKPCPQTYLSVLEGRKREAIIARMNHLPSVQLTHPVVQAEVFKEFAVIRGQRKLANGIVESIRTYARSKRRAVLVAMT
jgi:hypothetical protein